MYLTEETVPPAALPVAALRAHLRLGTGFAEETAQDSVLEACLRSAIARIEAQTAKALIARAFVQHMAAWRDLGRQALLRGPVGPGVTLRIVDVAGVVQVVDPARMHVERDGGRPSIVARGFTLAQIPVGGRAEIEFVAGFGTAWGDVPADLSAAALMLAAGANEDRGGDAGMPAAVAALIAPWRPVRLWGGA